MPKLLFLRGHVASSIYEKDSRITPRQMSLQRRHTNNCQLIHYGIKISTILSITFSYLQKSTHLEPYFCIYIADQNVVISYVFHTKACISMQIVYIIKHKSSYREGTRRPYDSFRYIFSPIQGGVQLVLRTIPKEI